MSTSEISAEAVSQDRNVIFQVIYGSGLFKRPKSGHSLISVTRKYLGDDLFRYKLTRVRACMCEIVQMTFTETLIK